MVYRYEETMTAEEMANICVEVNFKEYTDTINRLGKKAYLRYYTNCFKSLLKEIQSDEKCLLYFVGMHFQSTSAVIHSGDYVYILTNRRIIMAGAFSNMGTMLIPFNALKMSMKSFPCAKKSLYLEELQDVVEGMRRSKDRLEFHAGEKTFSVQCMSKNISHKLCKEIHEILEGLKKQQGIENANR